MTSHHREKFAFLLIGNIILAAENFEFSRGKISRKGYQLRAEIGEFVYFFIYFLNMIKKYNSIFRRRGTLKVLYYPFSVFLVDFFFILMILTSI